MKCKIVGIADVNRPLVVIARGNDDCSNEFLNNEIDNVSKARDVTGVGISDNIVLDGKIV